jgi:Kef-type K+ transport system membrane component KefB
MNHQQLILFFLQVCMMLATALVFGQIMRKLHQPIVVGELMGGILLGPTFLGVFAPNFYNQLFLTEGPILMSREAVLKIGMLFFLFVAGLEVNMFHLKQRGLSIALTSILGGLVPFCLGFGLVLFLPGLWGPQAHEKGLIFALFMGTALSISALPVIAKILMDLSLIQKQIGTIILTAATIDDLFGWSVFAVILGTLDPDTPNRHLGVTLGLVVGLVIFILGLGHLLRRPILYWARSFSAWPSGLIGLSMVLVLAAAALAESIHIHAIFGAFLVGIALGQNFELERDNYAYKIIYQLAVSFFAPLYFVSIGLKADFAAHFDLSLVLLVFFVASAGKIGGACLGAWIGGMTFRAALAVGFGMNARGAVEMILASVALEYQLIDQRVFVALILMAVMTSMLSGSFLLRLTPKTLREAVQSQSVAEG